MVSYSCFVTMVKALCRQNQYISGYLFPSAALRLTEGTQSDIKRPASPGTPTPGTGSSSSFAVTRPPGANAVRYVKLRLDRPLS